MELRKYNANRTKVLKINQIVRTVSETHKFDKDKLIAINTSDVENGVMGSGTLTSVDELKGQFKKTIVKDDILFSEIRPANRRFAKVTTEDTKDYVVSTKLMVLRKYNEDVDLEYFYYCLTNQPFLDILQRRAENRIGSFPQITFDLLSEYAFPIPPISEQKRISSVIATLDKKIALNRAINQNLEAMMKQLYDYWFVQFDFPNEAGKPYKSSGGEMVRNEELKREIPQGWSSISIGDYAPCKSGYAFKSKDFGSKGLPVIKIGNIQENYTLNMTDSQCIDFFNNTLFLAKRYDLVIAMTGATIGKFAISQRNYWVNQRVGRFYLGDRPLLRLGFLFNSLKQEYFREQVFQIACGCAQPNISAEQIDSISVLKPNDIILNQFNKLCEPLLELQSENYLELEELTKQRNELLPLLMNGQVSVNSDLSDD
ncbi:restriction endonuclease subunit S [Bacteroides fragilis]|nr:restriction endonuclease subunit S [Bacteroides fragilis]